jgi:hypothetical protein
MEEAKTTSKRPEVEMEEKVAAIRKEAEEKIATMSNKVAAAFYKDDDSIATIEEGVELVLVAKNSYTIASSIPKSIKDLIPLPPPIQPNTNILTDEQLIASIIIMKSLIKRQNESVARLDSIEGMLEEILGVLRAGWTSNSTTNN